MILTRPAASSGETSGVGLAMAKTIGSGFMRPSASAGTTLAPETPISRSVPSRSSGGALGVGGLGVPALHRVQRPLDVVLAAGVQRAARVHADDVAHARRHEDL